MKVETSLPPVGTVLTRSHQGIEHQVVVLADGFEHAGTHYASLSAIAREITGRMGPSLAIAIPTFVLGLFVVHAMRRWAPAGAGTAIQTLMLPTLGAVLVGALVYGALAAAAPETEHPDMPIGEVVAGGFAGIVTGAVLLGSYLARWRKDDRARSRVGWVLDLCGLGCLLGALVDTWT